MYEKFYKAKEDFLEDILDNDKMTAIESMDKELKQNIINKQRDVFNNS